MQSTPTITINDHLGEVVRRAIAAVIVFTIAASVFFGHPAGAQEQPPTESVQYAAAVAGPSTVYIQTEWTIWVVDHQDRYLNEARPFEFTSRCSGFVVHEDGYVATAGHCVDPAKASRSAIKAAVVQAHNERRFVDAEGRPVGLNALLQFALANWTTEGQSAGATPEPSITVALGAGGGSDEVLPSRVLEYNSLNKGDWALLKVNATDLPVVELADDESVHVGTEVLAIGFPASSDQVVDHSGPTFKDGRVSSTKTRGNGLLPVYEISAAVSGGMSGGPTVDLAGRVIGVNSFKITGEEQQFNFISPVSLLREMLARHGVASEMTDTDHDYREAVAAFLAENCTLAAQLLEAVTIQWPDHQVAEKYLNDAERCVADQEATTPVVEEPKNTVPRAPKTDSTPIRTINNPAPVADTNSGGLPIGPLAGVAIGALGVAYGYTTQRKRAETPTAPAPATGREVTPQAG